VSKTTWYILGGLAAFYFLFLRKSTRVTGGANLSLATGNNATPYPGYAPGQYPPGVMPGGSYSGAAPAPPAPSSTTIIQQAPVDNTAAIIGAVGSLVGNVGTGLGSVFSGLGSSGLLDGGGGGGGSYVSDDWV
jgi:hypothetical protein